MLSKILQLAPEIRRYVWGGDRLLPGETPIAEVWVVDESDKVAAGPHTGRTLSELAVEYGPSLLGKRVFQHTGERFPLLIKLLDCAQWLSLQVHPTDELAVQLEGPGYFGKTEAWVVLDAQSEARLIAGLRPGILQAAMQSAIQAGTIVDLVQYLPVRTGETIYMPAGTIHALGPGLMVYEVQQASDLTYRVYDWGRPQTGGRVLHIDKALAVVNAASLPQTFPQPDLVDGGQAVLCSSKYFTLELLTASSQAIAMDTHGETFHALTVIEGRARIEAGDEVIYLDQYQTALIPAVVGGYKLAPLGSYRLLKTSVEEN